MYFDLASAKHGQSTSFPILFDIIVLTGSRRHRPINPLSVNLYDSVKHPCLKHGQRRLYTMTDREESCPWQCVHRLAVGKGEAQNVSQKPRAF